MGTQRCLAKIPRFLFQRGAAGDRTVDMTGACGQETIRFVGEDHSYILVYILGLQIPFL